MSQHKAQCAGGWVFAVELMVVEVGLHRVVGPTDIDDRYGRVIEVVVGGVSPEHRDPVSGYEYADGQKVVFMGAAWVRENGFNHVVSQHGGSGISMLHRSYLLAGTREFTSTLIEQLTASQQVNRPLRIDSFRLSIDLSHIDENWVRIEPEIGPWIFPDCIHHGFGIVSARPTDSDVGIAVDGPKDRPDGHHLTISSPI